MDTERSALKPAPDRRRTTRVECQLPVVMKWVAKDGSPREETTQTKVINAHGCFLLLKALVIEGINVELVNPDTKEVRKGRVIWCGEAGVGGGNDVGIELENPDPKFWGQKYDDFLVQATMRDKWVG